MVLPQGFKNVPTILGKILSKDLQELELERGMLIQYVDGLLIASPTKERGRT